MRVGIDAVVLPSGEVVRGKYPGSSFVTLTEHRLRDELARQLHGATESPLPYGRADVLTATYVFEVEPATQWRHAVRQVLAYSAMAFRPPAIALFGKCHRDDMLRIYLKLRDGRPPIDLWWWMGGSWQHIGSRNACRNADAPH